MNKILDQFLKDSVDVLVEEFQKHNVMPNKQAKATFQFLTDISCGKVPTTGEDGPDATLTIRTSVQVPPSAWDANDRRIKHAYAFPEIAELWHSTF